MAANDVEHLPAGWTLQLKVQKTGRRIRYYMNLDTGKRFFDKDDLLQYVRMGSSQCNKPRPSNSRSKRRSEYSGIKLIAKENERPKWLPDGWVMELKTRKSGSAIGRQYKIFIDPLTGCKFFSKPEVLRYLESIKKKKHTSKQEKARTGTRSSNKVVIRSTANDLPPGWIKETRIRKSACGIRKDPYYTDPVSGYIFRSKKAVLHYLETGEIGIYAFKPAKSGINDAELVDDEALTSTAAKRQELKKSVTRRQLFEGKASLNVCSSALPEAKAFKKRRSEKLSAEIDLDGAPTAEVSEKTMTRKVTGNKESINLNSASLPKSTGSKKILADNLLVSTPTNSLQGQNLLESGMGCSYRISLNNSSKSKKKKKVNLTRRSSKRLAGHEPELVVNCDPTKCSPKNVTTKPCKGKAIPTEGLMSDGLADKASEQLKVRPVKDPANCISSEPNFQSDGEPSNKIKASKNLANSGEQMQTLESVKTGDGKSEPCPSFPFGSSYLDPCLEFAFKTLTGEIPVDDLSCVSTPVVDVLQDKILQETEIGKSWNRKTQIDSIETKNKLGLTLPRRSSKRLAGLEPELVPSLMFNEQSCGNVTENSGRCEASTSLADGVSPQLGAGNETGLAHHDSTGMKSQSPTESSDKRKRNVEAQTVFEGQAQELEDVKMSTGKSEDQPQKLEAEKMNIENVESQFFSFGDSLSDPCLEFAYKTLTGAIPVENNFPIQDYIQHQLAPSHVQIDGDSGLPDLGFPSSFETDILFQFDTPEKQSASQQQFSVNQSLLPSGNVSSPSCSNIASQQPCFEGNKEFHGKVKS